MEESISNGATKGPPVSADELRRAIEGDLLHLYYQPIVSLDDRSATMLEALPRWPDRGRGILAPADFIAVAIVRCVSGDSAPTDIAEAKKRRQIASTDSTSSSGAGVTGCAGPSSIRSRIACAGRP